MITLNKISEVNQAEFERLMGNLSGDTHVMRAVWDCVSDTNSTPLVGWENESDFVAFETLFKCAGGHKKVILTVAEMEQILGRESRLVPKAISPRAYAFSALNFNKIELDDVG